MGLFRKADESQGSMFDSDDFFRTSARGARSAAQAPVVERSPYLLDLLRMCRAGRWGWELAQFMPPTSLRESAVTLIELGLLERFDSQLAAA